MIATPSRRFWISATALMLAACGDSVTAPSVEDVTEVAPNVQSDQDVVVSAAATIAGAIYALRADEAAAGISTTGAGMITAGTALLSSGTTTTDKPPGGSETTTWGDKTETRSFSRSFTFFDAAGNVMPSFVHGTTASVRFLVTTDLRRTMDSTYVAASHTRSDHILSGLLGDRRIWNGTALSHDTTSHRDGTSLRTYTGTAADTTIAVTFLADREVNRYPLSGTSIRVVNYVKTFTGKETGTLTVTRRIVVTYNGTNSAELRIGTVTCTLNLDTRKAEHCS